jgi:hypothetical protein
MAQSVDRVSGGGPNTIHQRKGALLRLLLLHIFAGILNTSRQIRRGNVLVVETELHADLDAETAGGPSGTENVGAAGNRSSSSNAAQLLAAGCPLKRSSRVQSSGAIGHNSGQLHDGLLVRTSGRQTFDNVVDGIEGHGMRLVVGR